MNSSIILSFRQKILDSFFYKSIVALCVWASSAFFFRPKVYETYQKRQEYIYNTWVYHMLAKMSQLLEKLIKPLREAFFASFFYGILNKCYVYCKESIIVKMVSEFNLVYLLIFYVYVDKVVRSFAGALAGTWDELLMIVFVVWLLARRILFNKRYVFTNIDIPLAVFIMIYTSIMFIYSPDLGIGVEGLRAVVQYMFWFFMVVQLIDNEKTLERVLFLFPISIGLLGLHGTYQYITGAEMLGNWVDSTETIATRAYSIIGGPNALASVLVLNIPIALGLFVAEKDILKRLVYIVACLFMGTGLIFTFSRAAWVAAFIAVIIFFLFIAKTMIIPITTVLIGMVVMIETLWARISMLFTTEYYAKASDGGRIYRWSYAIEKWSDTKLFGLGVGRFGGAVATNHNLSPFYMDNYYLKTMTESGIAGVTSFILLQLTTVYQLFMYIRGTRDRRYRIIMASIFAGLIGVLLHNSVENIFESPFIVVYFWTYVGVLVTMYKIDRKRVQSNEN